MATKNLLVRLGIDLSGVQQGTQKAKAYFSQLEKLRLNSAKDRRGALAEELSKAQAELNKLQADHTRMLNGMTASREELEVVRQLKAAQREMAALEKQYTDKKTGAVNIPSSELPKLEQLSARADALSHRLRQLRMDPGSSVQAQELAAKLQQARARVDELRASLKQADRETRLSGLRMLGAVAADTAKSVARLGGRALLSPFTAMARGAGAAGRAIRGIRDGFAGVGKTFSRVLTRSALFKLSGMALQAFSNGMQGLIQRNAQLSKSLGQIKGNLLTAFAPIMESILPAITKLASGLASLTAQFANMIATLFGRSVAQAQAGAQALETAASAGAGRSGADFDITHKADEGGAGSSIAADYSALQDAEVPAWMQKFQQGLQNLRDGLAAFRAGFDAAWNFDGVGDRIEASWKDIGDRLGRLWTDMTGSFRSWCAGLDLSPAVQSVERFSAAVEPVVDFICDGLQWAFDNVLLPFGKWIVEDSGPASLNVLSGALKIVTETLEFLQPPVTWLWNDLLDPLASWTGGAFVSAINFIAGGLNALGEYMNGNKNAFKDWWASLKESGDGAAGDMANAADGITGSVTGAGRDAVTAAGQYGAQALASLRGTGAEAQTETDSTMGSILSRLEHSGAQAKANAVTAAREWLAQLKSAGADAERQTDATGSSLVGSTKNTNTRLQTESWAAVQALLKTLGSGGRDAVKSVEATSGEITRTMIGLRDSSGGWGSDFVGNFVSGISSRVSSLLATVRDMANQVRSYLHFTVPDRGPLADADTWMPDMMQLMSEGIQRNRGRVLSQIRGLAAEMQQGVSTLDTLDTGALPGLDASYHLQGGSDDLVAVMRSELRQLRRAVEEKDLDAYLDGRKVTDRVTSTQNRWTRMNGKPVVTG